MKKIKTLKSKGETLYIKNRGIPKGCQYCLNGAKTVLFLNGICQNPDHCWWYCPISKERKGQINTYANEIEISSKDELIEEIHRTDAKGISITGGDPLFSQNLEKTISYIEYIKVKMGNKFHIHLYTNGLNFNEEIADKLAKAGLDEIRFNPPEKDWGIIAIALNKGMKVGAEVPVIPDNTYFKNLKKNILYLDEIGADFINLNEFEYCFPNSENLKERGFKLKSGTIATVEKSREFAEKLINEVSSHVSIKIHFCPIIAKDYYQLKERYLRRAKNIKLPYEDITQEGLLMFGQIEGENESKKISRMYNDLKEFYHLSSDMICLEENIIKLPLSVILNNSFIDLIEGYNLDAYVVETTPFREKQYNQITEKSPLKVYKEEQV